MNYSLEFFVSAFVLMITVVKAVFINQSKMFLSEEKCKVDNSSLHVAKEQCFNDKHINILPTRAVIASELNFWGSANSEEQIIEYCSKVLFPQMDPLISNQYINVISTEVPILVIDNFLSTEMCSEIILAAINEGKLKRSTLGANQEVSEERTSSTIWLHEDVCEIPLRVLAGRVSRLIGLPANNMENLQVVKYNNGQHFGLHTDHQDSFNELDCKGRIATCLVYLNSSYEVDGRERGSFYGGETSFPEFGEKLLPLQGRAIFFFNTKERPGSPEYDPHMPLNVEFKSRHAGLPVNGGTKWVANRWVHPVPLENGIRDDVGLC